MFKYDVLVEQEVNGFFMDGTPSFSRTRQNYARSPKQGPWDDAPSVKIARYPSEAPT